MNRTAVVIVALLSAASAASAQAPQLAPRPPELCGQGSSQPGRHDLEVAQLYGMRVPSPRWLAVTVVERRRLDPITLEIVGSDRDRWVGETIVDRCDIATIATPPDGHDTASSAIELLRTRADDHFTVLLVTESPKAICATLDDCAAPATE